MASPSHYRIVIALDRSEYAQIVMEHALDQAVRHDFPDLHFLMVVPSKDEIGKAKQVLSINALEGLDAFRGDRTDWRTQLHVRSGDPADEIGRFAADVDADLLVIGRYNVPSISENVVKNAPCPTLVVGLAGRNLDAHRCEACVEVRESTEGVRWFCDAHSGDHSQLSLRVPNSASLTGGGLLW